LALQELEAMKQKLKELEEEAAKLRSTQVSDLAGGSAMELFLHWGHAAGSLGLPVQLP
jgi:hypothetical protein